MVDYESKSWLGVMARVRGTVIPTVAPRVLGTAAAGALAAWLFRDHGVKIPTVAHTLLGVALGLLLVFRTNASYDRFWEGRKLFGAIINRTRDLARQISLFVDGVDAGERTLYARWINLLYALICQYLRRERDLAALGPLVTDEERSLLEPVANRPNLVMAWIGGRLVDGARAGRTTEQRLQAMDANLTAFADYLGGAERIMKTPLPFAYAHHIKTLLALFVVTAPFAMAESMGWYTPLAAALLAFGMFGIEEIGVQIEDPFGYDANDLPLDRIGKTIALDVEQIFARPMGERARAA